VNSITTPTLKDLPPPPEKKHLRQFSIWSEGYMASGDRATAQYLGTSWGETFEEACQNFATPEVQKHYGSFTPNPPALWGCRLYDNEVDARRFEHRYGFSEDKSGW